MTHHNMLARALKSGTDAINNLLTQMFPGSDWCMVLVMFDKTGFHEPIHFRSEVEQGSWPLTQTLSITQQILDAGVPVTEQRKPTIH
jgi:hypothetical protein